MFIQSVPTGSYLCSPDVVTSFTPFNWFLTRGTFSQESPPCRTRKRLPCGVDVIESAGKKASGRRPRYYFLRTAPSRRGDYAVEVSCLRQVMSRRTSHEHGACRCGWESLRHVPVTWTANSKNVIKVFERKGSGERKLFSKRIAEPLFVKGAPPLSKSGLNSVYLKDALNILFSFT